MSNIGIEVFDRGEGNYLIYRGMYMCEITRSRVRVWDRRALTYAPVFEKTCNNVTHGIKLAAKFITEKGY